jgi:hypothetical protein
MTAANKTNTPDIESLDLSDAIIGVASPDTSAPAPVPQPAHPAASSASNSSAIDSEHRSEPRYLVKWHIVALLDSGDTHHGHIKDISFNGISVLLERNLQHIKKITLHIHVPPLDTSSGARIVEVEGKFVYTIHDHEEHVFRTGLHFGKFKTEADKNFLQNRLVNHHIKIGG